MSGTVAPDGDALHAPAVESLLRSTLPAALPGWLARRRWYADKGRVIRDVELNRSLVDSVGEDWLALVVVKLTFGDGENAHYLLPLALTRSAASSATPDLAKCGSRRIVDATETSWFSHWLLDRMAQNAQWDGRWAFSSQPDALNRIERARASDAVNVGVEQSNTSIRFDEALIVKVIRRLQPGPNPDEEVLRALSDVGFVHAPALVGSASWQGPEGLVYPIVLAQAFVPNQGDGWTWTQRRLAEIAARRLDPESDAFAPERLLGRRTGGAPRRSQPGFDSAIHPGPR